MNIREYIDSGILELYVAGNLSEAESREVRRMSEEHPEVLEEIRAIEAAYTALGERMAPEGFAADFEEVLRRVASSGGEVRQLRRPTPWWAYVGWAAAVVLGVGLLWLWSDRQQLQGDVDALQRDVLVLEQLVETARDDLAQTEALLRELRARDISVVPLGGQDAAPEAYAKVYWNKNTGQVLVDALGLPDPPPGMVYQVWSLKLDPLTPTSLGLLEDFTEDENRVFSLPNPNESEAFGITLEPAGGSESPTLEQLYTLGVAATS